MKQEREKSTAMRLTLYPLAEPGCKKPGGLGSWDLKKADLRGREKKGLFLLPSLPVLWPSRCRCSTQEAHPLLTASLLRRKTHGEALPDLPGKTGQKGERSWASGRRHHQDATGASGQGSRTHHIPDEKGKQDAWHFDLLPTRSLRHKRKFSFWRQYQELQANTVQKSELNLSSQ